MKLIIGLGNPGKDYADTWHNLGFMALDKFQKFHSFGKFKKEAKLLSEISVGQTGKEKIILAKPLTFMNNSGQAVALLGHYFKITAKDIIVIQDDLDLALGKIRLAGNSSAGGHNGIKSIIETLHTKEFIRIKIGVKTDKLEKMDAADYVLENIGSKNKKVIGEVLEKSGQAIDEIIEGSLASAMNKFN